MQNTNKIINKFIGLSATHRPQNHTQMIICKEDFSKCIFTVGIDPYFHF
jgi:hypothetical protein